MRVSRENFLDREAAGGGAAALAASPCGAEVFAISLPARNRTQLLECCGGEACRTWLATTPAITLRLRPPGGAGRVGGWGGDPLSGLFQRAAHAGVTGSSILLGRRRLCPCGAQAAGGGHLQAAEDREERGRQLRASELAMMLDGIDLKSVKRVKRYGSLELAGAQRKKIDKSASEKRL